MAKSNPITGPTIYVAATNIASGGEAHSPVPQKVAAVVADGFENSPLAVRYVGPDAATALARRVAKYGA